MRGHAPNSKLMNTVNVADILKAAYYFLWLMFGKKAYLFLILCIILLLYYINQFFFIRIFC